MILKKILRKIKSIITNIIKKPSIKKPLIPFKIQKKCNKIYLGTEYGGWDICPDYISKDSIIYSFGIGEDISFDLEIIKKFGCKVYAFDPTPKSINWLKKQDLPDDFYYYDYGIADFDGLAKFFPPDNPNHVSHTILYKDTTKENIVEVQFYKLESILNKLGHKRIDVLKMDIEGAEYKVIDDILKLDIDINQILIEFHHFFPQISIEQTINSIEKLNEYNYKIYSISQNGNEYSFIRDFKNQIEAKAK